MAEEELVTAGATSPTTAAAGDSHKRKLEDLELNSAPEPLDETEHNADPETANNASNEDENGAADESDAKRPRVESNSDNNVDEADGSVSQNGHQKEQPEEGEPEEKEAEKGEPEEKEAEQPEPVSNNASAEGEEPVQETLETITEEPAANENEKPEIKNTEDPEQTKAEVTEPTEGLPREGDVPVESDDQEPGSHTQIISRKIEVPNDKVGVLIGKAGDTIRSLQDNSGAKIQIVRDSDADPRAASRPLELVGTLENITKAERLIKDVIAEADAGGSPSLVARGFNTMQAASGGEQLEIQVPIEKVGLIIGKGGETIRNLQTRSGARIQLIQQNPSDGDQSKERTVRMSGNKKQIENAHEMIKDVMNQNVRPSPLSGGYNHRGFHPRGPNASQWGPRGPRAQFSGYDYPQRGPYPSQGSQYPRPSYGNYPPPQGPRSNYGPSWEQRPPASMHGPSPQGNYNYGQQQGPDYGRPPPYSQTPSQPYGHGYNDAKYDHHTSSQPYGHMGSQPSSYAQGGNPAYGQPDQYGKPPMYGMQQQAPQSQPYVQPRPTQPGEVPYQAPISSTQSYAQNAPPQQSYPYAPTQQMQQSYAPYGPTPTTDGYGHPPATAAASGYPPQAGQPAAGYNQPVAQQPPGAYPTAAGGYGSYPTAQTGYADQTAATAAAYGYQADQGYGVAQGPAATYTAAAAGQAAYAQPAQTQPSYDQSGYGSVPAAAGYGKTASPQPAAYPQYDATGQMYGAPR